VVSHISQKTSEIWGTRGLFAGRVPSANSPCPNVTIAGHQRRMIAHPNSYEAKRWVNRVVCSDCFSASFRMSRIRVKDIKQLVLLRLPVRCRQCHRRCHVNFRAALLNAAKVSYLPKREEGDRAPFRRRPGFQRRTDSYGN
jgi:hypothetical protein